MLELVVINPSTGLLKTMEVTNSIDYPCFKGHWGVTRITLAKEQILHGNSKVIQHINFTIYSK